MITSVLPCLALHCRNYAKSSRTFVQVTNDEATGVTTLALNRPPVNSLSLDLLTEIAEEISQLEEDKSAKAIVLTSAVPNIFSGGIDILEIYQAKPERLAKYWRALQEMWLQLYGSRLITFAAVNGHAPAGGCLMAMCCDYRIMSKGYTIGLNETLLGIVAPWWFRDTMKSTIGNRQTELSLQLGKLYNSEEAKAIGLVDKVVEPEMLEMAVKEELSQWLKIPGTARQLSKLQMRQDLVEKMTEKREEDINFTVGFLQMDPVQKSLGRYMEQLKKRKTNRQEE